MEILLLILLFAIILLLIAYLGILTTGERKILTKTFIGLLASFIIGIVFALAIIVTIS